MVLGLLVLSVILFAAPHVIDLFVIKGKSSKNRSEIVAIIGVLPVIILWGWYFKFYESPEDIEEQRLLAIANDPCNSQMKAYEASQSFVRDRLKSSSSASFPWDGLAVDQPSRCRFVVAAKVEAKNSFGVMLTNRYIADLEFIPSNGRYKLHNLIVQ